MPAVIQSDTYQRARQAERDERIKADRDAIVLPGHLRLKLYQASRGYAIAPGLSSAQIRARVELAQAREYCVGAV